MGLVISLLGVPKYFLSDRGPNFSEPFLQVLGVAKNNTSGYHQQCLVEKFNSKFINMLAKSLEQHRGWDIYPPTLYVVRLSCGSSGLHQLLSILGESHYCPLKQQCHSLVQHTSSTLTTMLPSSEPICLIPGH